MTKIAGTLLALLAVVALEGCGGAPGVDASPAPSPATSPAASPTSSPIASPASSLAATTAPSVAPATEMTVSLGIYSGRPDPSWDLTDAQAAQVESAIEALPVTTGTPPQGGLGYHGFTILIRRPGQADETLVAYRGTVAPQGAGPRTYRIDQGRTVERLLLYFGRPMLATHEIAAVEADLLAAP